MGNLQWDKTYGDSAYSQYFATVSKIGTDGDYCAIGSHWYSADSASGAFIIRTDSLGNLEKAYIEFSDSNYYKGVFHGSILFDTLIYTAGFIEFVSPDSIKSVSQILKLDTSDNLLLDRQFWSSPWDTTWSSFRWVNQTMDGQIVYAGQYGNYANKNDIWLLLEDIDGNSSLDIKYDFVPWELGTSVHPCLDGGFILSGKLRPWNTSPPLLLDKGIIFKVDSVGNIQWQKIIKDVPGINDTVESYIENVLPVSSAAYVAVGTISETINPSNYNVLLLELDSVGNENWRRTYEITPDTNAQCDDEYGYDVKSTSDGGYIITGYTRMCAFNDPQDTISDTIHTDVFAIKTNCLGFTGPPLSDFTYSIASDTLVEFSNLSDSAGYFTWYFGDGDSLYATEGDTFKSPVHIYPDTGYYTVTLVAEACGEYDTLVQQVGLCSGPAPQAIFTYSVNNDTAFFTNQSINASNYRWYFGDGVFSFADNPAHIYTTSGNFVVTLIAENCAMKDTITDTVFVCIAPAASFAYSQSCFTVTFANQSANAQNYLWLFGDGDSSTAVHPQHTYAYSDTFEVILISENCGKTDTLTDAISLNPTPPSAAFAYSINCYAVQFTNQSANAQNYLWSFGDGDSATVESPAHQYQDTGLYIVTLIAECGLKDTITDTIFLDIGLSASFTYTQTGDTAAFTNQSANAQSYLWDFGDSNTDTAANPVHVYADSGAYAVTLNAIACGDTAVAWDTVVIITTGMSPESESIHQGLFIRIIPNPTTGSFTLLMETTGKRQPASVYIYNILSEQVYSKENLNNPSLHIDLTGNPKGMYFVKLMKGGELFLDKIIYQ